MIEPPPSFIVTPKKKSFKWLRRTICVVFVFFAFCIGRIGYMVWQARSNWIGAKRLYESGNYHGAVVPFRKLTTLTPWDAEAHYWLANSLAFNDRRTEAVPEMQLAARLDAKNDVYQTSLGNLYQSLHREREAVDAFRASLALKNNDSDVHVSLGYSLYKLGKNEDARSEFREALRVDPNNRRAKNAQKYVSASAEKP